MIEINNLTTKEIDEESLKRSVELVLKEEGVREKSELSLVLVGSGRMRKLNRRYRGKNKVTDVLAFPEPNDSLVQTKENSTRNLGELVICLREVAKNAKRLESSFDRELVTCLVHGLLHLLGYDHEKNEDEAERMMKKQREYLSKIFHDHQE
jgi:probable rRNA maturation factor